MKLSILDQAPITKGNRAVDALKNAEQFAILGDELGYQRMWFAKTKNIRIGTGGVMMMHYSC